MTLPFAARQQFLEKGYAILPHVLSSSLVERVRSGAISSITARSRYFIDMPTFESLMQCKPKLTDPLFKQIASHAEKRRYIAQHFRRARRRKQELRKVVREFLGGRTREELSGDDMWKLSQLVAELGSRTSGRNCTSTVNNDVLMLKAINEYRANAWMTNTQLAETLRESELKAPLAQLAEIVGGVEKPVVFSDSPIMREAYGNATAYHCTAPQFGVRTNVKHTTPAVTLLIFTHTPSSLCLAPHVLTNSQGPVRKQYLRSVKPNQMFSAFLPSESHIPFQLKHFTFDSSVVGESLVRVAHGSSSNSEPLLISAGTVMVVDPHLMMAFGPNMTAQSEVIYRLNVVSEDARPFLLSPSWIRGWRSHPYEVNFAAPVVFPPLYS